MKKRIVLLILSVIIFAFSTNTFAQDSLSSVQTSQEHLTIIQKVEQWYRVNTNYATITALMAVESSFIPFPSEIVIPPAAYIACEPDSDLNIVLVVVFGTLGALIGALINYFLALYLGRIVIYRLADSKLGRFCMIDSKKIDNAEKYFNDYGNVSTFIGRLIPGIRQLISIPAGLAKMNLLNFMLYTTLGATVWNVILAALGYVAHGQQDKIHQYSSELSYVLLAAVAVIAGYIVCKIVRGNRSKVQ